MRSYLRKYLVLVLVVFILQLSAPPLTFSQELQRAAQAGVDTRSPEILGTPEKRIPTVKKKEKKSSTWTWLLLLGLAGGAAAAAGGGGGGGGSSGGESGETSTTGDVAVGW